jgi:murein DD-endopeptidase MepM/ murein hydrolase activator NlpD
MSVGTAAGHGENLAWRNCMNIIIVGKAHAVPTRIDLDSSRGRLIAVGILGGAALALLSAGFAAAVFFTGSTTRDLREITDLRATIVSERDKLANIDADSHRNLDALARELGQLQAQATRLNALGDRLTEVGKLDDGEFDFSSDPAMGGPEEPAAGTTVALPIGAGIDNLRAEFDRQEAQLGVLENLLLDRKVDNALLPSGMPVAQGYMASGFGERSDPINGHEAIHLGLDFDAPAGTPVLAVAEGVVSFVGVKPGYGNVVEIDHGNGYMTRYAHNSAFVTEAGARVHAGDTIAKVGSTGRATGPHCHFEVWLNGRPVNPMAYVKSKRAGKA